MKFSYLYSILERHLNETRPIIAQLKNVDLFKEPVQTGRPVIEVVLHIIRSLEYYSKILTSDDRDFAKFTSEEYKTSESILTLYDEVQTRCLHRIKDLPDEEEKSKLTFNRDATKVEILQEMIEHSIQHRGQLLVYYRLLEIEPAKISYIL